MTVAQLHDLYRAAHAEARRITEGGLLRAFEVSVNGAGITALERLMLEFALHDATNGTPARSHEAFERALARSPELLERFGLRVVEDAAAIREAA